MAYPGDSGPGPGPKYKRIKSRKRIWPKHKRIKPIKRIRRGQAPPARLKRYGQGWKRADAYRAGRQK